MKASRGARGASFTLVTPANHYPSRLPPFGDAQVVKLVTPRFAPARIGQYLVALPAGRETDAIASGYETFLYALAGVASLLVDRRELPLAGGRLRLPARVGVVQAVRRRAAGDAAAGQAAVRAVSGLDAPGLLSGHRADEPFADTPVPGFRRRELLPPGDPAFDFNMSLLAFDAGVGLDNIEVHDEEHGLYMTAGAGLYFLDGELLEVEAGRLHLHGALLPAGLHGHRPRAGGVPALQGHLARRLLARAAAPQPQHAGDAADGRRARSPPC